MPSAAFASIICHTAFDRANRRQTALRATQNAAQKAGGRRGKKKGERKQWKAERREWLSYFETEETKLKKMRDERIEAVMEPMRVLKRGEVELLAGDAADESSSRRSERDATLKLAAMTHAKMLAQRARDATAAQRCQSLTVASIWRARSSNSALG